MSGGRAERRAGCLVLALLVSAALVSTAYWMFGRTDDVARAWLIPALLVVLAVIGPILAFAAKAGPCPSCGKRLEVLNVHGVGSCAHCDAGVRITDDGAIVLLSAAPAARSSAGSLTEFFTLSMRGPAQIRIAIRELSRLSDAALATIRRQDPSEPMQHFSDRLGRMLSGACPRCGQRIPGPALVLGGLAMERGRDSAIGLGSGEQAERFRGGHCPNPGCGSEEVVLSLHWRKG